MWVVLDCHLVIQKNLVRHASLEAPISAGGLPDGWDGTYSRPDEGYKALVVDGGRTGHKSLVIQGKGAFGVVSTNSVLIDRNMRYRAQGWVRIEGDAAAAADVKFHYLDGQSPVPRTNANPVCFTADEGLDPGGSH